MSSSRRRGWLQALVRPWFPSRPTPQRRRRRGALQLELLEDRVTPNAYLVNVLGDAGTTASGVASSDANPLHGDLRYVLNKAIADKTPDTIGFDTTVFTTAAQKTITLSASLVTEPSGFTNLYGQTAFILGAGDNVTIDGSLGTGTPGITVAGGSATRLFVVEGGGTLALQNLTLSGGSATGYAGGPAGSGGAGRGGAGL